MTQEYDEGPWVEVPEGAIVEGEYRLSGAINRNSYRRYRILTPKPRREFVVGKWYRVPSRGFWRCIAVEGGRGWLASGAAAELFGYYNIDWSIGPRDEAPE